MAARERKERKKTEARRLGGVGTRRGRDSGAFAAGPAAPPLLLPLSLNPSHDR